MAELITTTQQLRLFLGGAYSASSNENRIQPFLALAEENYITKAIGKEIVSHLKTVANNENAASDNDKYLLGLVRRALAFYGYLMYLPYATGVDGDNGLQETKTDKTQPVRQAMLEKRIAATSEYASSALEAVLIHLYTTPANYPAFNTSDTFANASTLFIRSGSELKDACPYTRGYYRLYVSMRENIAERQRKTIVPILGEELAESLLAKQKDGTLSPAEKKLILYVRRALAYAAYHDSMLLLTVVQLANGGLRVLSEFDGINNQRALSENDALFCKYRSSIEVEAEAYEKELKRFLEANADYYELFTPSTSPKPQSNPVDNSQYQTIFRMR